MPPLFATLSRQVQNKMKLAAELVRNGATVLAEPCQECGGIQVRFRGKVYCTGHDDISAAMKTEGSTLEDVMARVKEVATSKLGACASALEKEKDFAKQRELSTLMASYLDLLQKLPDKGKRP